LRLILNQSYAVEREKSFFDSIGQKPQTSMVANLVGNSPESSAIAMQRHGCSGPILLKNDFSDLSAQH